MALSIYKPGQGYWTRTMSAVGAVTLVGCGVVWLGTLIGDYVAEPLYWQTGMAVGVIAVFGALIYWVLNKPRVADFMIATEAEMKKVNWPSKREIIGATIIVIAGTLLIALLLFVIDLVFGNLFIEIGILNAGSA